MAIVVAPSVHWEIGAGMLAGSSVGRVDGDSCSPLSCSWASVHPGRVLEDIGDLGRTT